jgi:L-galactose dehydrogenase
MSADANAGYPRADGDLTVMETVRLGRTELQVSVAGLGTGGASRAGQGTGQTEAESLQLLARAFELGVNYIDTAPNYGTEALVGQAVARHREHINVSTKIFPGGRGHPVVTDWGAAELVSPRGDEFAPLSATELRDGVHRSLRTLGTQAIDVYHLHAVTPDLYDHVVNELVPEMQRLRDAGDIRFLAISEFFPADPGHEMLTRATKDHCWDVVMVAFSLLNPSARRDVLAQARVNDIGVEVMGAARGGFTQPERLAAFMRTLVQQGKVKASLVDQDDPFASFRDSGAESLVDAAYRFCRHEPGCHVILTGTGTIPHLEQNIASLNRGPLPPSALERFSQIFGQLDQTLWPVSQR